MLGEIKSDLDASLLTEIIIANTALPGGAKGKSDVFWVQGEMGLIKAIALYCVNELPKERQNMGSFYSMITTGIPTYLDGLFTVVKPGSPARLSYNIFLQSPEGVRDGIISGMANRLQIFQNGMVRAFTATSDIDLSLPGQQKCAYFCIMPDYHSAYDYLSSMFFSFLFIRLIELADNSPGQKLPVPCFFLLDEFPNIAGISDFKKKLATIRSRNMHASIVFQDLSQLEDRYPNKGWTGIIGNCDWRLFLGANDPDTARFVETLLGKGTVTTQSLSKHAGPKGWLDWGSETSRPESRNLMNLDEVLRLPVDEAILFVRGQQPLRIKKMDYSQHPLAGKLVDSNINDYLSPWATEMRDGLQLNPIGIDNTYSPPAMPPSTQPPGQSKQPRRYNDKKAWTNRPDAGSKGGGGSDESFFPKPAS
jgi:type IV secretion system protein VirD4